MQLQTLIPFIPLMASLAAARWTAPSKHYDQICPQKDGVEEELHSGLRVTYHCNQRPGTKDRTAINAANPSNCVSSCSKAPDCVSSIWVGQSNNENQPCIHYHSSARPIRDESRKVLYMTHRVIEKDDDLFGDECEDEKARINELEDKLEQCRAGGDDEPDEHCPFGDHRTVKAGGKSFKVYCNKLDDYGHNQHNLDGSWKSMTSRECIEACSKDEDCDRAIWTTRKNEGDQTTCWLRPYTERAGPIPTRRSWYYSSAHVQ